MMIVDGKTGNSYDAIADYSPSFSPDGQHIAYFAKKGLNWTAVLDSSEGKVYTEIITRSWPGIVFDSNKSFHYLGLIANRVYLAQEQVP